MKKRILIVTMTLSLVIAISTLYLLTRNTAADDFDNRWSLSSKLIGMQTRRGEQDGLLFIKLQDGDEHFFPGDWSLDFGEHAGTFIYGRNTQKVGEKNIETFYYLAPNQGTFTLIDIGEQTYSITKIQENKERTYFFIQYLSDGHTGYCIAERLYDGSGAESPCGTIDSMGTVNGIWNPEKDHEVLVQLQNDRYFTYDAWEAESAHLSPTEERHAEVRDIFASYHDNLATQDIEIKHFGPFVYVPSGDSQGLYRVPLYSKVSYIADNDHLLVKTNNTLYILELSTQTLVSVLENNLLEQNTIYFRGIKGANSL